MNIKMSEFQEIDLNSGVKITDYEVDKVIGDYVYIMENNEKSFNYTDRYKIGLIILNTKNGLGKVIFEPQFKYLSEPINNSFIYQRLNLRYGIVNDKGQEQISSHFYNISSIGKGFFEATVVRNKEECTIINDSGEEIFKRGFDKLKYDDSTKLVVVGRKNLINIKAHILWNAQYKYKYGVYDLDGNEVLPLIYQDVCILDNDLFLVNDMIHTKIINRNQEVIKSFPNKCNSFNKLNNQFIQLFIYTKNSWIVINNKGDIIIDKQHFYASTPDVLDDIIGYKGLIKNNLGETLYECSTCDDLTLLNNGNVLLTFDGDRRSELYFKDTKTIKGFNTLLRVLDGCLCIEKNDKKAILDLDGNYLTNFIFKSIYYAKDGIILADTDEEFGLFNTKINKFIRKLNNVNTDSFMHQVYDYYVVYSYSNHFKSSVVGMVDINGNNIIPPVQGKCICYVNKNQVIVDGYLYNINDLKINYNIGIGVDEKEIIVKTFDSEEKRQKAEEYIWEGILNIDKPKQKIK